MIVDCATQATGECGFPRASWLMLVAVTRESSAETFMAGPNNIPRAEDRGYTWPGEGLASWYVLYASN